MLVCLQRCCGCLPQRYVLVAMIVLGLISCYLMRTCLQIALNEMTFPIPPAPRKPGDPVPEPECPKGPTSAADTSRAEFHWDQTTQQNLITSAYVGYVVAHLPAGVLSDTFGGKHVFAAGILLSSLVSLITPLLARASEYAFMAGRFVLGFGQGVMFPCASALVAKWAPPNERSTMTGFVQAGVMLGNAIAIFFSTLIMYLHPGWDKVFYYVGGIGLLWCILWYSLCYSSPEEHPFISDKEKEMIQTQIALTSKKKPKSIPWCRILLSLPFWSACLINFGHAWALFTMVNSMPLYSRKILNYNMKDSAVTSALPHLAMIPSAIGVGYLCDWLIKRNITPITLNRKIFAFSANILPIPFLLGASFARCDITSVIGLLMTMMFFKGFSYATCRANPVDLSPNFAGVLMGIMNGTGAFAGILTPYVLIIFIGERDGTLEEWRSFYIMSCCLMAGFSLPFLCFGSGLVQPWNHAKEETVPEETTLGEKTEEEAK